MGYLLSYPRSGNHLVRTLIEFLTRCPTTAHYGIGNDNLSIASRFDAGNLLGVDPSLPPAYMKVHRILHLGEAVDRGQPLVFILRDPRECISSDLRHVPGFVARLTGRWDREWAHVIENAREYDAWPAPKLLLFYEDLMTAPAGAIRQLGTFLGAPEERVEEAVRDIGRIGRIGLNSLPRRPKSGADPAFYRHRGLLAPRLVAPEALRPLFARYPTVG